MVRCGLVRASTAIIGVMRSGVAVSLDPFAMPSSDIVLWHPPVRRPALPPHIVSQQMDSCNWRFALLKAFVFHVFPFFFYFFPPLLCFCLSSHTIITGVAYRMRTKSRLRLQLNRVRMQTCHYFAHNFINDNLLWDWSVRTPRHYSRQVLGSGCYGNV
jgi:hypothetical protein